MVVPYSCQKNVTKTLSFPLVIPLSWKWVDIFIKGGDSMKKLLVVTAVVLIFVVT